MTDATSSAPSNISHRADKAIVMRAASSADSGGAENFVRGSLLHFSARMAEAALPSFSASTETSTASRAAPLAAREALRLFIKLSTCSGMSAPTSARTP